eukprot:scaffold5856_cov104-Amphora_coffeaeformis.AAC.1
MEKYGFDQTTRRCGCPTCGGNPRDLVFIDYHRDDNEEVVEEPVIPEGTRFADKPSANRPFRAPKPLPTAPPKAPPQQIVPKPHPPPQQQQFQGFFPMQQTLAMQQWHWMQQVQMQQMWAMTLRNTQVGGHAGDPNCPPGALAKNYT